VDHDHGRRHVEQRDREQPEDDVRGPELRRDADPAQADDEQDLGEDEVGGAELLLERCAAGGDALLLAREVRGGAVIRVTHGGADDSTGGGESRRVTYTGEGGYRPLVAHR
jgi:hypothetical protein